MELLSTAESELAPAQADAMLADLGFLLIPGPPLERPPAYLMVALRPQPTRRHFDPEHIDYWAHGKAGAERLRLEWPVGPSGTGYAWGTIRVGDRVRAINRFTSFGGQLSVTRSDGHHVAVFSSEAPILDLGEHRGLPEPLAALVDGFFARIRAAGGDAELATPRAGMLSPGVLYSAFIESALGSLIHDNVGTLAPELLFSLRSERDRLMADPGGCYPAGRDLSRRIQAYQRKVRQQSAG